MKKWRSQRDSNPHIPVRGRTVYPLAYAILLLPLRLELRYTGMALTPADGGGSILVGKERLELSTTAL